MKGPTVYYWDASMFLAFLRKEKGRFDVCEQILTSARGGHTIIVTSSFSVVEVVHIQGRDRLTGTTEALIEEFFRQPYIHLIDATRMICTEARRLTWKYRSLRPKDATHLASALYGYRKQPYEVHSFDPHFTNLSQKLSGTPPLRIIAPEADPTLFTEPVPAGTLPLPEVIDVEQDLHRLVNIKRKPRRKTLETTEAQSKATRRKKAK